MIIDNQSNLLENSLRRILDKIHLPSFQQIAKKVFIRFKIVKFDEGLSTTFNIFQEHVMLVRSLNSDHILILLISKNADMGRAIQIVSETKPEE